MTIALVEALTGAAETVSGKPPEIIGMGLVGDANLYDNDGGVKTVYYGPGTPDGTLGPRASLRFLSWTHCAQVYALAAVNYCGIQAPGNAGNPVLQYRHDAVLHRHLFLDPSMRHQHHESFFAVLGIARRVSVWPLDLRPLSARCGPATSMARTWRTRHGESYRALGVRPLINAAGTYTTLTGSVIAPEVRDAMAEASRYFVPLIDLQLAVGERIAKLIGVEAAMVSCGAASSITLATAACITQGDPDNVRRIPDTTGMKNRSDHGEEPSHGLRPRGARRRRKDRRGGNA